MTWHDCSGEQGRLWAWGRADLGEASGSPTRQFLGPQPLSVLISEMELGVALPLGGSEHCRKKDLHMHVYTQQTVDAQ